MNSKTLALQNRGLAQFPVGTLFQWTAETPLGVPGVPPMRKGKFYKVVAHHDAVSSPDFKVCEAVLCRRGGKPFKERHHPFAYALAEALEAKHLRVERREVADRGLLDILRNGFDCCTDLIGPPGGKTPVGAKLVARSPLLCLVLGDNASGKSLIRKLITEMCRKQDPKVESIHLSLSGRCSGGIVRGFLYGDEGDFSTGYNSVGTIEGALRTSRGRETPHAITFDEPDTGLSDRWARCAGREIAAFLREAPPHLVGVFLITHRSCLVEELLALEPSVLLVGHEWPQSLEQWLAGDPRPAENLEGMRDEGLERFRQIAALMRARKEGAQ